MNTPTGERRNVLVTGASGGIGRSIAVAAAASGARVAVMGRDEDRLRATLSNLVGEGHLAESFDLTRLDEIAGVVASVAEQMGGLDTIVHAAGIQNTAPLRGLRAGTVQSMFDINVVAGMMLAKALRQRPVHRDGASIVFVSSVFGIVGESGVSAYSASKGAVIALIRSLAIELARDGVRVNGVAPGLVVSEMSDDIRKKIGAEAFEKLEEAYPLGLGTPDDVVGPVLFLASEAARWITGTTLTVDGGYTAR